jgi:hypothetical protein
MIRSDVQEILDEVLYGQQTYSVVYVYTRFQVVRLEQDANGKFPAFTLSDSMLCLERPAGCQWVSLDGIDLITADI